MTRARAAGLLVPVAAVAFLVRLVPVLTGGGLHSFGRYDDGVYYTAADAFSFGRVPYRDFVLLHPPGVLLVLMPFALLGRASSDATGMAVARIAFMAIGAFNAVLVAWFAHRWGQLAAGIAGFLYACWVPAVYAEQSTLLEPLGTTAVLIALLLLCRPGRPEIPRRAALGAGVALGLGATVKVWYVAPLVVLVVWLARSGRGRPAARVLVAALVSAAAVLAPFFALAAGAMFRMVVIDQLHRSGRFAPPLSSLPLLLGVRPLADGHGAEVALATFLAVAVISLATSVCLAKESARVVVAVFVVDLLTLLGAPAFYPHYANFAAGPMSLVVGIGLSTAIGAVSRAPVSRALTGLAALGIAASGLDLATTAQGTSFPGAALDSAAPPGCVAADDPQALIQMNRLSSDLRAGCVVPVDVTGITYDRLHGDRSIAIRRSRESNPAWQHYLHVYLFSARCFVVIRATSDGMAPTEAAMVNNAPVLAHDGVITLRAGSASGGQ